MDTEAHTISPIQRIVREETDDGRRIVRFLVAAMQDQIRGAKPYHRLDAARQLIKLGFEEAKEFASQPAAQRALKPLPQSGGACPESLEGEGRDAVHTELKPLPQSAGEGRDGVPTDTLDTTGLNPDLARFIRAETDGGRQAIRFLIDVMLGFMPGFGPHHRIDAAKELLRRGFDDAPGPLHHDTYADAELNPLPQSAGASLKPLPQSAGASLSPLPQSAGEGRDGVPPSADANGASLSPLPQSAGEGRDGAPDILAGYEPPYSNTYGHSEDTGVNNRAVSKAANALMDAVGRRPPPPDPRVVYPSKLASMIIHNGEEHYFSEHARPAVEHSIAAGEIMDAVRRIRDSCRGPIRIACPHRTASCDCGFDPWTEYPDDPTVIAARAQIHPPEPEPTADEPAPSDPFPSLLGKAGMGSSDNPSVIPAKAGIHPPEPADGEPDPSDPFPSLLGKAGMGSSDNPSVISAKAGIHPPEPAPSDPFPSLLGKAGMGSAGASLAEPDDEPATPAENPP